MPQLSCAAAEETGYPGSLMIRVTSSVGFFPVVGAAVTIADSASPGFVRQNFSAVDTDGLVTVRLYFDYIIGVGA